MTVIECPEVVAPLEARTPLDGWLREQQELTAVDRFVQRHQVEKVPAHEHHYRDLLPATSPGPGQQYRFEVDLDQCSGCKACVTACHSLNGLDDSEAFRSVGVLIAASGAESVRQHVTTACHHCVDPACLSGCPVDAYTKDPLTGIVEHLDDQCIGCSYCELTCPYEVPTLNRRLGVVRKCDMCSDRLANGEAPACVQACPTGAIAIGLIDVSGARGAVHSGAGQLLPGAPPSDITKPTTIYRSRSGLPLTAMALDADDLHPCRSHPPLAVMLVLTQLSVGGYLAALATAPLEGSPGPVLARGSAVGAALLGVMAMAASLLHLGRPLMAWRAFLGLRHSWLSREIAAFSAYGGLAVAGAAVVSGAISVPASVAESVVVAGAMAGIVGVVCSAFVYSVTHRPLWRLSRILPEFVLTATAGGALLTSALLIGSSTPRGAEHAVDWLLWAVLFAGVTIVGLDIWFLLRRHVDEHAARSVRLLLGPLRRQTGARLVLVIAGSVAAPAVLLTFDGARSTMAAAIALVILLAGQMIGRLQFFTASVGPGMPGIPR